MSQIDAMRFEMSPILGDDKRRSRMMLELNSYLNGIRDDV